MDIRWDNYVRRDIEGFPLVTLLGVRDGRGFFLSTRQGEDVLLQAAAFDPAQLERWRRAAALSHPHVNQIFAAGEARFGDEEPTLVYAVSPVPDDDLSEQLERGAFDADTAGPLLTALANALDYLHGEGLAHHAVNAASVLLVGGSVRLAPDSIAPGTEQDRREDVRQLGRTLEGALRGSADERIQTVLASMQSSDPSWSPGRVLQALAEPLTPPAPPAPKREPMPAAAVQPARPVPNKPASFSHAWAWIAAVAVVVVGLALFVAARSRRGEAVPPVAAAEVQKPAMFGSEPAAAPQRSARVPEQPARVPEQSSRVPEQPAAVSRQPVAVPRTPAPIAQQRVAAPAAARSRTVPAGSSWAVIAATYGAYQGAEKRAAAIRQRWPEFEPIIYPPAGEGRRYYVVLGSGLSRDEAEGLYRRAKQAGMPRDTYVTKLGG